MMTQITTIRQKVSHKKRAKRRQEIIDRLNNGDDSMELAREYNLTPSYIKSLIRGKDGLTPGRPVRLKTYDLIAALCKSRKPLSRLAKRFGQKPKTIQAVYQRCVEAGIPVKKRFVGRPSKSN